MSRYPNICRNILVLVCLVAYICNGEIIEEIIEIPLDHPYLEQLTTATPGLSGSIDYADFEKIKKPLTRNIVKIVN